MKCECSIEVRPDYLYLTAIGSYDEDFFLNLPRLVKEASDLHGKSLVLLDGSKLTNLYSSTMTRYELGLEIVEAFKNKIKLGVIWPSDAITYYTQTIAEIHGTLFKVFNSEKGAKEWLLNK